MIERENTPMTTSSDVIAGLELALARISRHKDLRILMNVYYRESVEDIAARLN